MAVKIRLKRLGRKKAPVYRIVVADSRSPRDGRSIAILGEYDPLKLHFEVDKEKVAHWLNSGAQLTDATERLFGKHGVIEKVARQSSNQKIKRKDREKKDKD